MLKHALIATVLLASLGVNAQEDAMDAVNKAIAQSESAQPDAKVFNEEVKINLEKKGEVLGIKELPMKKLYFVEAERGTYVVSSDGRFVFDGRLVDVWHRKTIKNLADANSIQRTPINNIGLDVEKQLATFQYGNPNLPRSGVAFVDPTSKYTTQFLEYIEDNKDKYNWTVVLAPLVGGTAAVDRARRLFCAENRAQAKKDFTNGTSESFGDIKSDCPEEPIQMVKLLVDILSIEELPHIVREDGLVSEGLPLNFEAWYEQP